MARKKVVYWSGLIAALTFFGIMGLWGGDSMGQVAPPAGCADIKLVGQAGAGVDCGAAFIKMNEVPSGAGWYTALCVRDNFLP